MTAVTYSDLDADLVEFYPGVGTLDDMVEDILLDDEIERFGLDFSLLDD